MVAVTSTPTAVIIILPLVRSGVVPYLTDIGAGEPVFASVRSWYDTGVNRVRKPLRTIRVVERIYDKCHRSFIQTGANHRRRQRQTSFIAGNYIVVVSYTGLEIQLDRGRFFHLLYVPFTIVRLDINHVIGGVGTWFLCVQVRLPFQNPVCTNRQVLNRERLNNCVRTVEVTKYTFIYRTGSREAELRIQSVPHVRHVLMAEQFKNDTRNHRHTCLAVIGLFELASGPFGCDLS